MATSVNCANHTCGKQISLERQDPNVLCPLCAAADTVYCNEACRMMDWITHKCPNALMISAAAGQKEVTIFAPYAFEDTLNAKELKQLGETLSEDEKFQLENQRYLVQVQHPNQQVSQHLVSIGDRPTFAYVSPVLEGAFLEGMPAEDFMKDATVSARVQYDGRTIELGGQKLEDRIIYEGHVPSDVKMENLRRVLKQRDRNNEYVIFLKPKPGQPVVEFRLDDALRLETFVDGDKRVHSLEGRYTMTGFGMQAWNKLFRVTKDRFQALFPGADIKSYMAVRGVTRDNQSKIMLIFERAGQKSFSLRRNPEARMYLKGLVYTVPRDKLAAVSGRVTTSMEMGTGKPAPAPTITTTKFPEPTPTKPIKLEKEKEEEKEGAGPGGTTIVLAPPPDIPKGSTPFEYSEELPEDRPIEPPPKDEDEPPPSKYEIPAAPASPPPFQQEGEFTPPASPPLPPATKIRGGGGGVSGGALQAVQLKKVPKSNKASLTEVTPSPKSQVEKAVVGRRGAMGYKQNEPPETPSAFDDAQIPFPTGTSISLRCDASDLAQMVGLAMALDLRERELPEHAINAVSLVKSHARALMEKRIEDPSNVPTEISAAVYSAIQTLQELPVYQ